MSGDELVDDVNLARIRWCCEEVWMTREALADAVGVDAEKLERGGLTHRELNDIGEYFGYTGAFYCKPGFPDREAIYTSAYRSILSRGFPPASNSRDSLIRSRVTWRSISFC